MIPRWQRILLAVLLLASVVMAVVLIRLREHAADRLAEQSPPTSGAGYTGQVAAPEETVTLIEANDLDGSVAPVTRRLPLPQESGARARVLLRRLFTDYAAPESKHPLAAKAGVETGVDEVFFMPAPGEQTSPVPGAVDAGQTAIVNLTAAFAENHPSGIETETLTLLSIIGTLHENFPAVKQVRFLVDGRQRETLAGHADLTRAYIAGVP
jgi:hypothetical protein